MIKTFQDQTSIDLFQGLNTKVSRKIPLPLHRKTYLMLQMLHAAVSPAAMATPPGNRLHPLSGDLTGFWSVSLNDQYRIIFRFEEGHAFDVKVTDYH